jgi:bifunctional non-homologous end joining protein LigD
MRPGEVVQPYSDTESLFEMKFRGRRLLAIKQGDAVRFQEEDGRELAPRLPVLLEEVGRIRAENAVLDGVLVALDEGQRPAPEKLDQCIDEGRDEEIFFYAFDLLYYEEWDIRQLPLAERKTILASVLPKRTHLLHVDPIQGRGEDLLEMTRAAGLPGVIAKDPTSTYSSGASPSWREIPSGSGEGKTGQDVLEALSQAQPTSNKRKLKFSNLDKVFWPKEAYTKGDLISYYEQVADLLLPYLHERPIHMLRYPDGIEGKAFYQKDAPDHVPDWVEIENIDSETRGEPIRYIICNDRDTLLYLINLGSIDLHPWFSRRRSRETPDWAIIDLDPKEAPFSNVVKIARSVGKLLRGIGIRPYLKTSGKSGLHIYIPLRAEYTYEQGRAFCEGVARFVANEHKDIATVERVVSQRGKKVYIDYLQNFQGQTIVPPYVVRPVPGASVSAPLDWDELDSELHPSLFTIESMPSRLRRLGDLFRGTLTDKQDLLPAIEALQKNYLS